MPHSNNVHPDQKFIHLILNNDYVLITKIYDRCLSGITKNSVNEKGGIDIYEEAWWRGREWKKKKLF